MHKAGKYADAYKRKSANDGIDKRVLRHHRRSEEWKSLRTDVVNKRRNFSELTPVKECSEKPKTHAKDAHGTKGHLNDRKEKLQRWKEERELKKKLETAQAKAKRTFKVTHVEHEVVPFSKPMIEPGLKTQKKVVPPTKKTAPVSKPALKANSTHLNTNDGPKTRSHRLQAPVKNMTNRKSAPTQKDPINKPKQILKVKDDVKSKVQQTQKPGIGNKKSAAPKLSSTTAKNITKREKNDFQFAPNDFVFTAPANLESFSFKPLSPTSSADFFGTKKPSLSTTTNERCSTPQADHGNRKSLVVHSPAVSAITVSDGSDTENKAPIQALHQTDIPSTAHAPLRRSRRLRTSQASQQDLTSDEVPVFSSDDEQIKSNTEAPKQQPSPKTQTSASPKSTADEEMDTAKKVEDTKVEVTSSQRRRSRRSVSGQPSMETVETQLPVLPEEPEIKSPEIVQASTEMDIDKPGKTALNQIKAYSTSELPNTPDGAFRTPGSMLPLTGGRRHSSWTAGLGLSGSKAKTPRQLRKSFILRGLSPEECVEVLKHSPMIEMKRRTPRHTQAAPALNWNDVDEELGNVTSPINQLTAADAALDTSENKENLSNTQQVEGSNISVPLSVVEDVDKKSVTDDSLGVLSQAHDIPYFRNLLITETVRLNILCDTWTETNSSDPSISEEVSGQIRTTIGKAQLLIAQRFKQFSGLIDNSEFNTGEKEINCSDLQGFWDMIFYQVEDVDSMFKDLSQLKANNWISDKPKPQKKKLTKKPVTTKVTKPTGKSKFAEFRAAQMKEKLLSESGNQNDSEVKSSEESTKQAKPAAVSKFAEFRKKMMQQKKEEAAAQQKEITNVVPTVLESQATPGTVDESGTKLFEGGFFSIQSPQRSPASHCPDGSISRPRRSVRKSIACSTTPACSSPLLRAVQHKSARKSLNASMHTPFLDLPDRQSLGKRTSMSTSGRRSINTSERQSMSTPASPQLIQIMASQRSRLISACSPALETKSTSQQRSPLLGASPVVSRVESSIFTPEPARNPSNRRSTRRSMKSMGDDDVHAESGSKESVDLFSMYLQPTHAENTESEEKPMDLDELLVQSPEDIDMAAQMKRSLHTEFDQHSHSAKKRTRVSHKSMPSRRSSSSLTPNVPRRLSASEKRRSNSTMRLRRSVHFSLSASPPSTENQEPGVQRLPATPFNHNALVPAKRRSTRSVGKDAALLFTPPLQEFGNIANPVSDSPATRISRLRVESFGSPKQNAEESLEKGILSSPPASRTEPCSMDDDGGTINLMSFSPITLGFNSNSTTPSRSKRRSTRQSLLINSLL